jgi:hypothetical protein
MWTLPPTDSVLHMLSFVAVAAQAMTAAPALAIRYKWEMPKFVFSENKR